MRIQGCKGLAFEIRLDLISKKKAMSGVFNVQDVMSGLYRLLKTINPLITKRILWILAEEFCLPMLGEKLSFFSTGLFLHCLGIFPAG